MKLRALVTVMAATLLAVSCSSKEELGSDVQGEESTALSEIDLGQKIKVPSVPQDIRQIRTGEKLVAGPANVLFKVSYDIMNVTINELKAKQNPTDADAKRIAELENAKKMLLDYFDIVAEIPNQMASSINIMVGVEVPISGTRKLLDLLKTKAPLLNKIPRKLSDRVNQVDPSFAAGVFVGFADTSGNDGYELVFGLAGGAGFFAHGGKDRAGKVDSGGSIRGPGFLQFQVPAVALMIPTRANESDQVFTSGGLQGHYVGPSWEFNTSRAAIGREPKALSFSIMMNPGNLLNAELMPDTIMIYAARDTTNVTNSVEWGLRYMYYHVAVSNDGVLNAPFGTGPDLEADIDLKQAQAVETAQKLEQSVDLVRLLSPAQ